MKNGLYQSAKDKVLSTDTYVGFANSEIEDLFPPPFMADVVDRWERRADTPFTDTVKAGAPIVPQIEAWAMAEGITLEEGWKVDLAREAKKRALNLGLDKFDKGVVARWVELFNTVSA